MISIQNMTTLLPHESLDFLISRGVRFPDLFFLNQPNPHPKYPLPTRWAPQNQWNTWGWNGVITPVNRPQKMGKWGWNTPLRSCNLIYNIYSWIRGPYLPYALLGGTTKHLHHERQALNAWEVSQEFLAGRSVSVTQQTRGWSWLSKTKTFSNATPTKNSDWFPSK